MGTVYVGPETSTELFDTANVLINAAMISDKNLQDKAEDLRDVLRRFKAKLQTGGDPVPKEYVRADAVKALVEKWRKLAEYLRSDHNGSTPAYTECSDDLEQALAGMEDK